jgi:Omp85 superfamily domain
LLLQEQFDRLPRMDDAWTRVIRPTLAGTIFLFVSIVLLSEAARAQDGATNNSFIDHAVPLLNMPGADAPEMTGPNDMVDSRGASPELNSTNGASATNGPATVSATNVLATNKNEFLFAPIPSYKPSFGLGLQVMAGYLFALNTNDKVSPPSSIMAMGYGAENGSWLAGGGGRFFLKEDEYRLSGGVFTGRINYDYAGVGTAAGESGQTVPIKQNMTAVIAEPLVQIAPHLYLGPRYLYANMNATVDLSTISDPSAPPEAQLESTQSMIGAHLQYDTRDSVFYPRRGILLDLHAEFHDPAWGDDFTYQVYKLYYNQYISLGERQVLAVRGAGQICDGDVPYYSLATIGRGPDLRGYDYGQFQDKSLLAAQAEYRLELTKHFGAAAFAGLGEVAPTISQYTLNDILPSFGGGLRYVLAAKNHVALRLDFAWGRDAGKVYFTVGEAF